MTSTRRRREKITGRDHQSGSVARGHTALFFLTLLEVAESDEQLAGMDPEIRRRRTLDAIKRLLLRESLNQPLIVIFEDLHWLNDGSRMLLNMLADSIGTARFLMLVNYRPEFTHNWGNKTYYTQLRLDPLGVESGEEMLNALLDDGRELAPLKRLIIEKTDGNPFFMEEIVQALFEQGNLLRDSGEAAEYLSTIQIPSTVQAVLASRIDRLPPEQKDLLQAFRCDLARSSRCAWSEKCPERPTTSCKGCSSELQVAEFIYQQPAIVGCRVCLQARAIAASRLRLDADGTAQSSARTNCPCARSAISRDAGDPTRVDRSSLHRSGTGGTSDSVLATGR